MFNLISNTINQAICFIQDKKGAVAFEYVLIIGGVSVVVVGALAVGANAMFPQLITATCNTINTILPAAAAMTC